jgi:hypothetical protein
MSIIIQIILERKRGRDTENAVKFSDDQFIDLLACTDIKAVGVATCRLLLFYATDKGCPIPPECIDVFSASNDCG